MRGVPIRLEMGPRDVENGQVVLARRDTGEKVPVSLEAAVEAIVNLLDEIQQNMFQRALEFRAAHSHVNIDTMEEWKAHLARVESEQGIAGWVLAGWCGDDACEAKVKEETKFTSRNIPFEPPTVKHTCISCGGQAKHTVWFARAY
jgi:prolyl-tRNA synthetase